MTTKKKLEVILDKLSEQEIKTYLQKSLLENKKQRDHFLIHFDHLLAETVNPNTYRRMVKGIIYNNSDHGFIDYYAASAVCDELMALLDQARESLENNPQLSFTISSIVLEAIPEMAESIDDSNGETSTLCKEAVEIIIAYLKQADDSSLDTLFEWCMQTYENKGFSDYGYDEVDQLFGYFCHQDSPYQEQLLQILDQKIKNASEYGITALLFQKAELLKMWGHKKAARNIVLDNIDKISFRKIVVDEALAEGNEAEAIRLINEGISIAQKKGHSRSVKQWQEQLLDLAKKRKNQQEINHLSELLLLSSFSLKYYRLFKQSSADWKTDYPKLLEKIPDSKHNLAQIYNEEDDHKALFQLLTSLPKKTFGYNNSLDLLKRYMDSLQPYYSAEILEFFAEDIDKRAKSTGRSIYAEIVNDFKIMKKLEGGDKRVKEIMQDLLKTYRNRPAMREMFASV